MLSLIPFPGGVGSSDFSIDVVVERKPHELQAIFQVKGKIADLKIPSVASRPARKDFLWEHTCFEIFLSETSQSRYEEWNLSPSGDWAHYEFESYRKASSTVNELEAYEIAWMPLSPQEAQLVATLPVSQKGALDLGLSAVLELRSGQKTYWALGHPQAKPDFHQRAYFKARI